MAQLTMWLAGRSSRNTSFIDKACRWLVNRSTSVDPDQDFMRDEFVDAGIEFDPDELERYQRGG